MADKAAARARKKRIRERKGRFNGSYLTKEGFRNIRIHRLMSVASVAVMMSCLLLVGGAVAIAVFCYLSKDAETLQPLPYKNAGLFVLSLLFGIILLLNAFKSFSGFSTAAAGYSMRAFKELMSSGALPLLSETAVKRFPRKRPCAISSAMATAASA